MSDRTKNIYYLTSCLSIVIYWCLCVYSNDVLSFLKCSCFIPGFYLSLNLFIFYTPQLTKLIHFNFFPVTIKLPLGFCPFKLLSYMCILFKYIGPTSWLCVWLTRLKLVIGSQAVSVLWSIDVFVCTQMMYYRFRNVHAS